MRGRGRRKAQPGTSFQSSKGREVKRGGTEVTPRGRTRKIERPGLSETKSGRSVASLKQARRRKLTARGKAQPLRAKRRTSRPTSSSGRGRPVMSLGSRRGMYY